MYVRRLVFDFLFSVINLMVPKIHNSIYVTIDRSSVNNCVDIVNGNSFNSLCFIKQLIAKKFKNKLTIFIDYYFDNRKELYDEISLVALQNNIEIRFTKQGIDEKSIILRYFHRLINHLQLFRTEIWLVNSGDSYFYGKLNSQTVINMNYFISCKNDFLNCGRKRWEFLDYILTTSLLHSTTVSAQTGVKYDSCIELGFPRNDTLFMSSKRDVIYAWLNAELGYIPKKIIVYAPTYRDYEKNDKNCGVRELFGYKMDDLDNYLKDNQMCLICKLHNLLDKSILEYPKGTIPFNYCFDFTFYDLLSITDCVITDYSSLGYDFLLLNRPIIYNLYDYDKYCYDRGVSYEPYEEFCPGVIVHNHEEMMKALLDFSDGVDEYREKRERLMKIFHKNPDKDSAERVVAWFCDKFNLR